MWNAELTNLKNEYIIYKNNREIINSCDNNKIKLKDHRKIGGVKKHKSIII
jgi:hypothetical protein